MTYTDTTTGIQIIAHDAVGSRFVSAMREGGDRQRARECEWTAALVARGVTIAHPDDGWVDRVANTVLFAYPSLLAESPRVGSLVALGWPDQYRIVRLTREIVGMFGTIRWAFEDMS